MKPVIGISACLLGKRVRFDGGHKKDEWLTLELWKHVTFHGVCPEMEMGLGTPRESLRLERPGQRGKVRLVGNESKLDLTELAKGTADAIVKGLPEVDGFIFKKSSPSCGLERVKVYGGDESPRPLREGQGFFAKAFVEAFPLIPSIEEGRLTDPFQREHFVTRVFANFRVKQVPAKTSAIQKFHQDNKLLLMAHSPQLYQKLGRIAANPKKLLPSEALEKYREDFAKALAVPSSVGKRVNVLEHMFGYFRGKLSDKERSLIHNYIEEFQSGELSFLAALSVIRLTVKKLPIPYLESQLFLDPYPKKLALLKHL